jgi:uncharacterized hydrophobic protein (TIGR00271 family)
VLHFRVIAPSSLTAAVVESFRQEPGATNVVVLPGASVEPVGDLVQADVAREAADAVLDALRRCGAGPDDGLASVSLETVDAALGGYADRARADAPGEGADALVWEQLSATTGEDSTLSVSFLLFLVVATMIAAVGLLLDSQVLIVGAMVLGPEFGPLAGLAVAAVAREWANVWRSARAVVVGFALAVAVTALGVVLLRAAGQVPQGYLDGQRPLTSFVAQPDVFSVIVALLAGVAGTVSLTSAKSSALVGVFISVTTVPAAAEIAAASVTGQGGDAAGSVVQLAVNLVCIVLAALATLLVQRSAWRWVRRGLPGGRP